MVLEIRVELPTGGRRVSDWDMEEGETNGLDSLGVARNSTVVLKAPDSTERPDVGGGEGHVETQLRVPWPPFPARTDQLTSGNLGAWAWLEGTRCQA